MPAQNDPIHKDLNIDQTSKLKASISEQHKIFAECMKACIKRAYDGKIPSYAIIARDFSLRSCDGKSISSESIRKWMTGKALPHSQRLSTLVNWLGAEIASSLSLHSNELIDKENSYHSGGNKTQTSSLPNQSEIVNEESLFKSIQNLSYRDRKIILSLLRTLQNTNQN